MQDNRIPKPVQNPSATAEGLLVLAYVFNFVRFLIMLMFATMVVVPAILDAVRIIWS